MMSRVSPYNVVNIRATALNYYDLLQPIHLDFLDIISTDGAPERCYDHSAHGSYKKNNTKT